jgi:two-component system LytT family response regulator
MKLTALIVDDEPLARERLRALLAKESDLEIVGECADGDAALSAVESLRPQLLFLDVQMPGLDGFGVVQAIPRALLPLVIFVTAYDAHAVRAFEVHALDYILKPFKQSRLHETVERARAALGERKDEGMARRLTAWIDAREQEGAKVKRIAVRINERVLFVKTEQIDWIEAAGNYAVLHCGRENHVVRATLGSLETDLPSGKFLRVSRSAIVNGDRVKEIQPVFEGEQVLLLSDGTRVPVTRGLREIQEILKYT